MKQSAIAKHLIASLLVATMLCASFAGVRAEEVLMNEGGVPSLTPRLPKTVTEYNVDFETKAWIPIRSWSYTYEHGYPVLVDCYEIEFGTHSLTAYEYEFENGLPVSRTSTDEARGYVTTVEYVNGRPYNTTTRSDDGTYISKDRFQYANGDDYFTLLLHENHSVFPETPEMNDDSEEVDAVSVTSSNGLLVRTVNTGMYANWGAEVEKEWLRFNGTYTASYDGDGIVVSTSSVMRAGRSGIDDRFEAFRENGLITEATVLYPEGSSWTGSTRFVFEYTDMEMSHGRYATMINSFLMGESNNYYQYFWY